MRKIIFCIVIILLLVGVVFMCTKGFELGNFEIWGIKKITEVNQKIDQKNNELSNLAKDTYQSTLDELDISSKTLNSTKKDYEQKAGLISNSKYYMQTEKYEIDFLWTKIGNYAKDNGVQIKIDVVNSTTSGLYDLKFTIAGIYADIIEFFYDIENDSRLGFKIEEFHMSAIEGGVQATFTCKEIGINIELIGNSETNKDKDSKEENVKDEDTEQTNTTENTQKTNTNTTESSDTIDDTEAENVDE